MANRRELKKEINYVCSSLFTECVVIRLYTKEADSVEIDKVMANVLNTRDEYISRISHTQKDKAKEFYALLRKDFNAAVENIVSTLEKLS